MSIATSSRDCPIKLLLCEYYLTCAIRKRQHFACEIRVGAPIKVKKLIIIQ